MSMPIISCFKPLRCQGINIGGKIEGKIIKGIY